MSQKKKSSHHYNKNNYHNRNYNQNRTQEFDESRRKEEDTVTKIGRSFSNIVWRGWK